MTALASLLSQLGVWIGAKFAAAWGLRVGVIAALMAVYGLVWAALGALFSGIYSGFEGFGVFPAFLIQFFPSPVAVAAAVSMYLGTLVTLRSLELWLSAASSAAQVK